MNSLDLSLLLASLPAKLDKDELRIRLFLAAVAKKAPGLVGSDALTFAKDAGALVAGYAEGFNPKKWSLATLFGRDPLYDARENMRRFAAKWDLDPVFRDAMG